ncbi:helix-turn-helix transcriptional regulator [Nigerium massiliense]|uniref:helix-turn-helix transcriptional regulator n=1 Tax=Nigerium massiliense TaxID=1522317 RepID=UPI00058C8892|nr:helix-turn-helix domain-containing protein [Nigerium massiliense]
MTIPTLGPEMPAVTPPLSPARRRVLQAVADAPGTLTSLAEQLGGHPNTTRQHLESLLADDLIVAEALQTGEPGRPPLHYRATPDGVRALAGSDAVGDYRELVEVVAEYLLATGEPEEHAFEIGNRWGREKTGPDATAAAGGEVDAQAVVVATLDRLGFGPEPAAGKVRLRTCPLLQIARTYPEVMCGIHRGLVQGILDRIGADAGVRLEPFAEPGACLLSLGDPALS